MITEAIILAGGLGTRLRSVVADVPKCMAPVNGIPFIDFVITYLKGEGITRFIFSLGYKSEVVTEHLDKVWKDIEKIYVIEDEPLGTGGAIKKACGQVKDENVVIVNGDTIFNIGLAELTNEHYEKSAECTIALAELYNFNRYGTVSINKLGSIYAFNEKQFCKAGFINGGIYILDIKKFTERKYPEKFSFEKDYLEPFAGNNIFQGLVYHSYFIDIGVPEDYKSFELKQSSFVNPLGDEGEGIGGGIEASLSLFIQFLAYH